MLSDDRIYQPALLRNEPVLLTGKDGKAIRKDVFIEEGERGGFQLRAKQVPIDHYLKSKIISSSEYRAADRLYRDFHHSGQTTSLTCNLNPNRVTGDKRAFLPVSESQREALDNWRLAMEAVKGKVGKDMIVNVVCYGYFLKEMAYYPYNARSAMCRFREALSDLIEYYKSN